MTTSIVLSWMPDVRVLAPKSLRDRIALKLEDGLRRNIEIEDEPLCRFLVTPVITAEYSTDLYNPAIGLAIRIMENVDEVRIKWQHDPNGKQIASDNADINNVLSSEVPGSYLATFWRGRKPGYW